MKHDTFHGNEMVANTRRLCLMNMFLHNIGEIDGAVSISPTDRTATLSRLPPISFYTASHR